MKMTVIRRQNLARTVTLSSLPDAYKLTVVPDLSRKIAKSWVTDRLGFGKNILGESGM